MRLIDADKFILALMDASPSSVDEDTILDLVDSVPIVDVAPVVHGRWEWIDEDVGTPVTGYEREWGWRCSHCGEELPDDYDDPDDSPKFRFCYNCGAKMDGGDNGADD